MEKKDWQNKIVTIMFFLLLCFQIGLLCFYNLRDTRTFTNPDSSSATYHFMEVIRNGGLNIPEWNHTTTLEIDSSFLLAIPLFSLTHDIYAAMGVANILFVLLYAWVVYRILKINKVQMKWIFIVATLIFTPWAVGMLDYFNMLFYQASQYTVKTIVPLMFILIIFQLFELEKGKKRNVLELLITCLIYSILLFSTALSTGTYTFICGLLPVMAGVIYTGIGNNFEKEKWLKCLGMIGYSVIVFGVGFSQYKKLYPSTSKYTMNITLVNDFWENIRANILGLFQVFGALPSEEVKGVSVAGIVYCVKFAFCILLMICLVKGIKKFNYKEKQDLLNNGLTSICILNIFIVTIYDTRYGIEFMQYRYYIIMVVPLLILIGYHLSQLENKLQNVQKIAWNVVSICIVLLLIYGNNKNVFLHLHDTDYAVEMSDYFKTLDVESVIFVDDAETTAICRSFDGDRRYGCYMSSEQSFKQQICTYQASTDKSFYGNNHALAVISGRNLNDFMSEEQATQYKKVGTVRWLEIYCRDRE